MKGKHETMKGKNLRLMIKHMPTIARPDDRSVNLIYIDYCSIFNDKIQTLRVKNWYINLAKTHYCGVTPSGKNDKPLNPDSHSNIRHEKVNLNRIEGELNNNIQSFSSRKYPIFKMNGEMKPLTSSNGKNASRTFSLQYNVSKEETRRHFEESQSKSWQN